MKINFKQISQQSCGMSVIASAINHLSNSSYSLEYFISKHDMKDHWFSFAEISSIIDEYEIDALGYEGKFDELTEWENRNGYILLTYNQLGQAHYVYVFSRQNNKFEIADPDNKHIMWIEYEQLKKMFAGRILILHKRYTGKKIKKQAFLVKDLSAWNVFYKSKRLYMTFTIILQFLLNVTLFFSNNFVRVFMYTIGLITQNQLLSIFLGFSLIYFFYILLNNIIKLITWSIGEHIYNEAINLFIIKFINLKNEDYDALNYDAWSQKFIHIKNIIDFKMFLIFKIPNDIIFSILAFIVFSSIKIEISILTLCELFLMFFISWLFDSNLKNKQEIASYNKNKLAINLQDLVYGQKFFRAKNMQENIISNFLQSFDSLNKKSNYISKFLIFKNIVTMVLHRVIFMTIFILGAQWIFNGDAQVEDLIYYSLLSTYIFNLSEDIKDLLLNFSQINIYLLELKFIFIENSQNEDVVINEKINSLRILDVGKSINNKCVLNNNSKTITKNTFIYGKNGVGKTTMLQIIAGLFKNYEGSIAINNKIVNKISNNSVIYLDQFDYLVSGTVKQNLTGANKQFDYSYYYSKELDKILNFSNLNLETTIINNGANLSKGQRQIVSFLSLLFTNHKIYLIDEALSNVDESLKTALLKILLISKENSLVLYCDHNKNNISLFNDIWEIK